MKKPFSVLAVDDSEWDLEMLHVAFENAEILCDLTTVMSGQEAITHLEKNKEDKNFPNVILLDINMPGLNGFDVLNKLKNDNLLQQIPVIMLTSSSNPKDVQLAYSQHANSYIIKPLELDEFVNIARGLENFWHKCCISPY